MSGSFRSSRYSYRSYFLDVLNENNITVAVTVTVFNFQAGLSESGYSFSFRFYSPGIRIFMIESRMVSLSRRLPNSQEMREAKSSSGFSGKKTMRCTSPVWRGAIHN